MLRYLMAYPKKNFSYPGPSMWFSNRINWIISDVQGKKFFLIIFLASNKVLAMLRIWIGTCSVFFHSYSVSPGVKCTRNVPKIIWRNFSRSLAHSFRLDWHVSINRVVVLLCCVLKNSCLIISFILRNGTRKDCLTNQNTIAEVKEFMYETSHKRVWGSEEEGTRLLHAPLSLGL